MEDLETFVLGVAECIAVTGCDSRLGLVYLWFSYLRIAPFARIEGKRRGLLESALRQAPPMLQSTSAYPDLSHQHETARHNRRPSPCRKWGTSNVSVWFRALPLALLSVG